MENATIRPATSAEGPFLQRMLAIAADWRPGSVVRSVEEVLAEPKLAHYVLGWPRAGDFGVVASDDDGRLVGAAWCRFFTADDPGFGFVSSEVPEVSLGVVSGFRRRGVGRQLMVGLVDEARSRGIGRLSLSVEVDNPAMDLYAELGFVPVADADGAATMVLDLG
ncbi:MAG TPA: GNAT family N-acetyltransferase [Acidimicrobiales bacterium]